MININYSDSLKTLRQLRCHALRKSNLYKLSGEGRVNPILISGSDDGGYVFTEEMMEVFARIFATGPENPSKKSALFQLHNLYVEYVREILGL